jgi:hypothetical protein
MIVDPDNNDREQQITTLVDRFVVALDAGDLATAKSLFPRRVLSAPVAVADGARLRLTAPAAHLQFVDDQFGAHVISDRPAHNHA